MSGQGHTRKAIAAILGVSIAAAANANEVVIKGELDGEPESAFESGVFGSIGADVFVGDQISRRFAAARVGFDQPFTVGTGSGRVFVEAGFAHRNASIEQTRTRTAHFELDPATGTYREGEPTGPETRTVDVSASGAELREAYVEYNPTENIGLSLGYQRPVWGQFDVVSPVNLLLPLEFQSNDVAWEKSSYRMPQPMISATLFATERLELTGYWFAGTNLDPLHEEILNEGDGQNRAWVAGGGLGATEMRARPRKDFSDYHAGAARVVWYADGFTLGLTYYDGRNSLFASDELPLVERVMQTGGTDGSPVEYDAYSVIDRTALPKSQAFGVELSVPVGRWTWKAEAFRMSTETDIEGVRPELVSRAGGDPGEARRELYQWILNENGGRAYADIDALMMGAGFDALFDRWRFGAAAFTFNTSLGAEAEEANRLVKAAYPGDDGIETDTVWLPNAYLIRDFNEERTRSTGIIGGFAGPFFGLSAFYSSTWLDDWRWTASLEYAGVVSDQMLSDVNDDDGRYELDNIATLGARIGFLYEF